MSALDDLRLQVIGDFREGKITRGQAAALCQLSERSITRLTAKVRRCGPSSIMHGNRGRAPSNKLSEGAEQRVVELMKTTYFDFNISHAWEILREKHALAVSYDTLWRWCVRHGVGKRKRRRPSKARIARERMASRGTMLQMDGSHHAWNGKEKWCLIGAIDDSTSEVPACKFFETEATFGTMAVLEEIIGKYGLPQSLYVDQGKAFGGIQDEEHNQFRRACEELGITVINALSPQAKGRIERMWRTFQDRLIPELRINGITTMAAANRYLAEEFLPKYWNKQKCVPPRETESRYRTVDERLDLKTILCKKYYRRIRTGQLFDFKGRCYQLKSPTTGSIAGEQITIQEQPNGSWRVFLRGLESKVIPWTSPASGNRIRKASWR